MLLKGGIPIVTAFEMSKSVLSAPMQMHLLQAISNIKAGKSISISMETNQLCTPVAIRMLRVGERSGQMGEMMQYIGEFYDEDIARWLDWFTKLFEPALMAFIGLIVGVIVVLMYMPIFELAGSIQ
jgi:general secretion pathway protein F